MKHESLLLAVFLLICGWAQATTQVRDKLYWNGIEYHTIPLVQIEKYFSQEEVNKLNKLGENWTTTVNYRAYQFIFEIDNDSLFLKAIVNDEEENITESILGTQERRMMDNFSDTLFLGYGESMYDPAFWTMIYESEITVVFKNGVVQWLKDNKNKSKKSHYYFDNLMVINMLYSNIRWSSLDKETLQKKPEVILRIENDSIAKIENLSIIKSSGFAEFDEEAVRVIKTIPNLSVSFVKGKYIHHSYQVPIIFDIERVQELGVKIEMEAPKSQHSGINNQLNQMLLESIKDYVQQYNEFAERVNYSTIQYVCADGLPRDFPYDSLSMGYFFQSRLEGIPKKEQKHFNDAVRIWYTLEDNEIDISINNIRVRRPRKHRVIMEVSPEGTKHYRYQYSCETNEWKLIQEE